MKKFNKVLSTVLSFSLVFNMALTSNAKVFAEPGDEPEHATGFCVAGAEWREDGPYLAEDLNWYMNEWRTDIRRDDVMSVAIINDNNISAVPHDADLYITDMENNKVDYAHVYNWYYQWSEETHQDEVTNLPDGLFRIGLDKVGEYKLHYEHDEIDDVYLIYTDLPTIAMYSANTVSEEKLAAVPDFSYIYTPGEELYIMMRDAQTVKLFTDDENYIQTRVEFAPEFNMESIVWDDSNFAPIKITIPQIWAGYYHEAVRVVVEFKDDNPENESGIRTNDYRFHFNSSSDGLYIGYCDWDNVDGIWAPVVNRRWEEYSKNPGMSMKTDHDMVFAVKTSDKEEETINYLNVEDLNKISVLDDTGKPVNASTYSISQCTYTYWVDGEEGQEGHDVVAFAENVLRVRFNKTGTFIIRYTDGEYTSQVCLGVGLDLVSAYTKKFVDEKYCVGRNPIFFNDSRNTFYILADNFEDDWEKREFEFTDVVANNDSQVAGMQVKFDKENNMIIVKFNENATNGEYVLRARGVEHWVSYEERDGVKKVRESNDNPRDEEFRFYRSKEDIPYDDEETESLVTSAENVEKMINALPDPAYVKATDKDAILAAKAAYEALSDEAKALVEIADVEKLTAADENLGKALDAQVAEEEAKAAQQAANDKLKEDYEKADAKNKELEEANKKLEEANKKLEEAAKGSGEENKAAAVKVGDSITDTVSKADYKVLSLGTDNAMGTVEFVAPTSKTNKKFTVPSTITYKGVTYAVVAIGNGAFKDNKKLSNLVISEGIKTIGEEAFMNCSKLKKITVNTTALTKVGKNALKGIAKKAKILVPGSKFKKYKKVFKKKGQGKKVKVKKA